MLEKSWMVLAMAVAAAMAIGCDSGKSHLEGDTDTGVDPGTDTAADTVADAAADFPDVSTDDVEEPDGDATTDVPVDTAPDTAADTAGEEAAIDPASYGEVGDPCTTEGDCLGVPGFPFCLTIVPSWYSGGYTEYTNGYCSGDCVDSDDCGEGSGCTSLGGAGMFCMKICLSNADCREDEGYVCRERHDDPNLYCMRPRPPRPDTEEDVPWDWTPPDMPGDVPDEDADEAEADDAPG